MPEDQSSDSTFQEVEYKETLVLQIDKTLSSGWYRFYKITVFFLLLCSCVAIIHNIINAISAFVDFFFLLRILVFAWNAHQLYYAHGAIKHKDLRKAEKAMRMFKVFLFAMPMLFLLVDIFDISSYSAIKNQNRATRRHIQKTIEHLIMSINYILVFYMSIMFGTRKVLEKLKQREVLSNSANFYWTINTSN